MKTVKIPNGDIVRLSDAKAVEAVAAGAAYVSKSEYKKIRDAKETRHVHK